ncbi:nucleoside recognition domain-containing protein [Aestuariispira ectoiniformans]|uniref:nucleoside recognition domain-containing protein n=1 Tax=Aestuariispira ectoiniformans TaxID=2775080 RepID=UPI00223AFBD0|nr:nucleoside recognition domain-containing protein [Aestuariispira ectoiniformans]
MLVGTSRKILTDTVKLYLDLLKIMVPIMILVEIGIRLGLVKVVSHLLAPVMDLVGLPAEASIVLATNILVGLYGGAAALISLLPNMDYTIVDATVIGGMMLMAHSMPVEQRIVQKTGCSLLFTTLFRFATAFLFGWLLHKAYTLVGGYNDAAVTLWSAQQPGEVSWADWAWNSAQSLFMIFWILLGLVTGLKVMELTGITARLTRLLAPTLSVVGVGPNAAPLAMVGVLLGLAFGGGLILAEIRRGHLRPRSIFLSLCFMCLCHSLIEDTFIILALGADWVGVVLGRLAFTVAICVPLSIWVHSMPDRIFYRYLFRRPNADEALAAT